MTTPIGSGGGQTLLSRLSPVEDPGAVRFRLRCGGALSALGSESVMGNGWGGGVSGYVPTLPPHLAREVEAVEVRW